MGPFLTVTREDSVPHDYSNNSGHETFVSLQEEEFHFFVPNLHINFHRRLRLDRAEPQEFQDFFQRSQITVYQDWSRDFGSV